MNETGIHAGVFVSDSQSNSSESNSPNPKNKKRKAGSDSHDLSPGREKVQKNKKGTRHASASASTKAYYCAKVKEESGVNFYWKTQTEFFGPRASVALMDYNSMEEVESAAMRQHDMHAQSNVAIHNRTYIIHIGQKRIRYLHKHQMGRYSILVRRRTTANRTDMTTSCKRRACRGNPQVYAILEARSRGCIQGAKYRAVLK
jgi:hypothetical protein